MHYINRFTLKTLWKTICPQAL